VWQYYVAAAGALMLAWEATTLGRWLAAGPEQVDETRTGGSWNWYAAKVYEVCIVLVAVLCARFVLRGVRRERRLTFDAMFVIAGGLVYWMDPMANFFQPTVVYTSNFVNLANWCGHAPGVVNAGCSRSPEPVLAIGLLYAFGFIPTAMMFSAVWDRISGSRTPGGTLGRLVLLLVIALAVDIVVEAPPMLLNLWAYPWVGGPHFFDAQHRYPVIVGVAGLQFWLLLTLLWRWRDGEGRNIAERGLGHLEGRRRTAVMLLCVIGLFQLDFVAMDLIIAAGGLRPPAASHLPAYLVNDVCNAGGFTNSINGACPGAG
jgi:hypothetical protein